MADLEELCDQERPNFTPEDERLRKIVKAVMSAQVYSVNPMRVEVPDNPSDGNANPNGDQAHAEAIGSSASSDKTPQLTEDVLYVMCEAIWPDPNVPYILNYYRQMKEDFVLFQRDKKRSQLNKLPSNPVPPLRVSLGTRLWKLFNLQS
ncbi:MAG: hypothetical protein HYR94_23980 [Chloroflexi bacterium]|nr:hypothetical protein [Chloroflexota bacterium]